MSIIQFSHANGFPAKTYSVLFEQLKDHTMLNVTHEHRHKRMYEIH